MLPKHNAYDFISESFVLHWFCIFTPLRWLLGYRKLRSSKKVAILEAALVLQVAVWKKKFFMEERKNAFFLIFTIFQIIFCCAELFECAFHFKFCKNFFTFLNINTNNTSKEQDFNFIRSNHLFWEQPEKGVLEAYVWKKTVRLATLLYRHFWGF